MNKIIAVLSLFCFKCIAGVMEYDGRLHIKLYHALDLKNKEFFEERGNITFETTRSTFYAINQLDLNPNQQINLQNLADQDEMYRLKSIVVNSDGSKVTYLSSVKARSLTAGGLDDTITIYLAHSGFVMGISESVSSDIIESKLNNNKFKTVVQIKHMQSAPIPDTASYIQKLEREKEARERGEVKDNRSFLAKYWMYIVPIAIFVLISGAANPEAQSGGR
ncbi:ER membrane protein complex subunit 10-like [Ctenocephalides felis]|uniref:ER membrane protein complex subunit 10-like n=1 Tax=Ctenocephalides felis TaxID=7515 RepID=UPI000E6E2C14|nr:ER membrane protein complex subunit 10-like [Ctenocephalides felis]